MMKIGILKKGDEVLSVTSEFIAVRRKKGEVDIIPLMEEGDGWRVDIDGIVTIGYGENTVSYEDENGIQITNF